MYDKGSSTLHGTRVEKGYPERSGPSMLCALIVAAQPMFHLLAPPFPDDMIFASIEEDPRMRFV